MSTQPTYSPSPAVPMSAEKPTLEWIAARVLSALGHGYQVPTDKTIQKMMLADWFEDIGDLPKMALEIAFREWRRSSRSRPQPGDIRALARSFIRPERPVLTVVEEDDGPGDGGERITPEQMRDIAIQEGMQDNKFARLFLQSLPDAELQTIAEAVSGVTGIAVVDIRSHRRPPEYARARRMFSYLARHRTSLSFPAIAAYLDNDHTSVMTQVKRAEEDRENDPEFADQLALAERMLDNQEAG